MAAPLRPHDLVRFRDVRDLAADEDLPSWTTAALGSAPLAVVRRARAPEALVAIGIRGRLRHQRVAAMVRRAAVVERIAPERLAADAGWRRMRAARRSEIPALGALEAVSALLGRLDLAWGPTGGVGFELAGRLPAASPDSDLDLLVRRASPWPVAAARDALAALDRLGVRADVQIETPLGSVALREYARDGAPMLLRTVDGPRLVADPWRDDSA
jgi:phosphoribosyl-dephospho-CoA transferase